MENDSSSSNNKAVGYGRRQQARHINVPMPEMLDILRGRMATSNREKYEGLSQLVEASTEFEFLEMRRRLTWSFRLFSDGALGKEFVGRIGSPIPSKPILIHRELRFIADFITLMNTAKYQLLSKDQWDIAIAEDFEVTMPVKVNMKIMDSKMLTRFWAERPSQRALLPEVSDRILIFYRGISIARKRGLFIAEKLDLLVRYMVVEPFEYLWNLFWKKTPPPHAGAVEKEEVGKELPEMEGAKRISLRDLMPGWREVMQNLLHKMELIEPTFDSVVVLYRKAKASLLPSTLNTEANYRQAKRNIAIKMFDCVPSADLEAIFPDKVVNIRPSSWIIVIVSVVVALVSAGITLWQTDIEWAVVMSALMLIFGKLFQSYTSMEREKAELMTRLSKMLYDKTRDAQDGALFVLLNDMAEQYLKDLSIAYTLLFLSSKSLTIDELEKKCEEFIDENFGKQIDVGLKEKLPQLLQSGLIKEQQPESEDNEKRYIAADLDDAIALFTEKWNGYHKKFGSLDADTSLFDSTTALPIAIGAGVVGGVTGVGTSVARLVGGVFRAPFRAVTRPRTPTRTPTPLPRSLNGVACCTDVNSQKESIKKDA